MQPMMKAIGVPELLAHLRGELHAGRRHGPCQDGNPPIHQAAVDLVARADEGLGHCIWGLKCANPSNMNTHFRPPGTPVSTRAAEGLERRVWTVAEIEAMVAAGIIDEDERFELIDGEVVPMSPKGAQT